MKYSRNAKINQSKWLSALTNYSEYNHTYNYIILVTEHEFQGATFISVHRTKAKSVKPPCQETRQAKGSKLVKDILAIRIIQRHATGMAQRDGYFSLQIPE